MNRFFLWRATTAAVLVVGICLPNAGPAGSVERSTGKVGLLVTKWATPEGFDRAYYAKNNARSRAGLQATVPSDPCVPLQGTFPYRLSHGLLPPVVSADFSKLSGNPRDRLAFDSSGIFRWNEAAARYESVYPGGPDVQPGEIPPETPIVPLVELANADERQSFPPDPRDGTDHLVGWYRIGDLGSGRPFSNGIGDVDEQTYAAIARWISMTYVMGLEQPVLPSLFSMLSSHLLSNSIQQWFGEQVVIRFGSYLPLSPGPAYVPLLDNAVTELAEEGYTRLLLSRETTDNNNYANDFMTGTYARVALCQAGYEDNIEVKQVRQIGRTPEYNEGLLAILRGHLPRFQRHEPIAVVYATFGLPWPGQTPGGPFAAPHPWVREVYHENAFLNLLSFKNHAHAKVDSYKIHFAAPGKEDSTRVTDHYFGYFALADAQYSGYYQSVRQAINRAKADGFRQVLVLLSHWSHTTYQTFILGRELNGIPLNPLGDFDAGKFWYQWCEGANSGPQGCDEEHAIRLGITQAWDKHIVEFTTAYALRLRGGLERFAVFPNGRHGIELMATGFLQKENGGSVAVTTGPMAGARVSVPPDPHPQAPETFTVADNATDAFIDARDTREAAWWDGPLYLGVPRSDPVVGMQICSGGRLRSLSQRSLYVGPYRSLFNRGVTIVVPFHHPPKPGARLVPVIYNHTSDCWDRALPLAGEGPPVTDFGNRTMTFATHVFGLFAVAEER